ALPGRTLMNLTREQRLAPSALERAARPLVLVRDTDRSAAGHDRTGLRILDGFVALTFPRHGLAGGNRYDTHERVPALVIRGLELVLELQECILGRHAVPD